MWKSSIYRLSRMSCTARLCQGLPSCCYAPAGRTQRSTRAEKMTPTLTPLPWAHVEEQCQSGNNWTPLFSLYNDLSLLYLRAGRAVCQRETLKKNHQTERLEEGSRVGGWHFCQALIQSREPSRPHLHKIRLTHYSQLCQSLYAPCKKQSS